MNKKGFLTIVIIIAIFSIGLIIISNNNKTDSVINSDLMILKTKSKISNYYLLLNQSSQGCFNTTQTGSCIDSNSDLILSQIDLNLPPYNCTKPIFSEVDTNTYTGDLSCNTALYSKDALVFSNTFNLEIIVKNALN